MMIAINKVHFPVEVLGFGRRLGIWTQGCSIHCPGCLSLDTWAFETDRQIDVSKLLAACESMTADNLDGVTISGGEPFDQPEALLELIIGLRELALHCGRTVDILVYSGYPLNRLERDHATVLEQIDVLIAEPFMQSAQILPSVLRGSSNQIMSLRSNLARERYQHLLDSNELPPRFQVSVEEDRIWYIGIPQVGDLERLNRQLEQQGIVQQEVSWRS